MDSPALYVDMLGVRSAWKIGRRSVLNRLSEFRQLIIQILKTSRSQAAAIEADASVIVFEDFAEYLKCSIARFRSAFQLPERSPSHRVWLRGVIAPCDGNRTDMRKLTTSYSPTVQFYEYPEWLFDAISAEKSGYKGMRLLCADMFIHESDLLTVKVRNSEINIIAKLRYSRYPSALPFACSDVLWCLDTDPACEAALSEIMQRRLRWSAQDDEEFQHAAATQVLFHEVYAKTHSEFTKRLAQVAQPNLEGSA